MMNSIEVKVPNVGVEGEVEVVEVCVSPGDEIEVDSSLIVLESDKATVEVPSPCAGKVES
ncbi:biotin/lipoyl-containing protein, partial [Oleiphilus sp. HI0123]